MPKKPETLEDALVAIDRLEKVVARQAAKLDELIDNDIAAIYRRLGQNEDVGDFTLRRTDELGDDKPSRKEMQGQVRLMVPQTVERIRVRGKVVKRVKRA